MWVKYSSTIRLWGMYPQHKNNKPNLFAALNVKDEEFKVSRYITRVFPLRSNSDHQDYQILSTSLETFICHCSCWKGGQPNISHFHPGKFNMAILNDGFKIITPFKHSHFGYLYVYINFRDVCIPKIIGR